ncbi:MAG TPA: winged helix-turn-helix domain-containing protein [Steroidobacteraceae bacterium]|jgi:DNA-binding winged helix-turn-helix (wHTH) protein|nr:winged helix-turn-helix domain-containing protein [Steroidobacteraceae bacterium]
MPQERGTPCWKFGNARLDERTLELSVAGHVVELERKPLEVLRHLLVHAGEVVTHEQLLEAVWPGRVLSESVLTKVVSRLRDVLQDDEHAVVKTVHGYGYRLLAPVAIERPKSVVMLAPDFHFQAGSDPRQAAVLIVDIADTIGLRSELGDTVAGRRIRTLLNEIIAAARQHNGEFIKSYGDDMMAIFERDPLASAADTAVKAHRHAMQAGLQLYTGLHSGSVEFQQNAGYPDATGLTIDFAVRLHQLTPGAPGRIFMAEESISALPMELRSRTRRYGMRNLKGIGEVSIWTLDWQDQAPTAATEFSALDQGSGRTPELLLRHETTAMRVSSEQKPCLVGRGKECALRVPDAERQVSVTHLLLEFSSGHWFVQDLSRNGTWLRDGKTGRVMALPNGGPTLLPATGMLCLGRRFENDPKGQQTVYFSITED